MQDLVLRFLNTHCDWSRPVLVGVSGGPDSIALLHLLIECAQRKTLRIGVAHVDHRWREESCREAAQLKIDVERLNLPFHLKTLDPSCLKGNLEDACREERYAFFCEIARQYDYQAVILGHHRDDQAETILKRILEGSSLVNLKGIQAKKTFSNLAVWRPLLDVPKSDILMWLSDKKHPFFEDRTNRDPHFLRGRMRSSLFPFLQQEFGKEIKNPLIHISQEAGELEEFLKEHLDFYLSKIETSPLGSFLDLSLKTPSTAFELKQLLRYFLDSSQMCLSRSQMDIAVQLIKEKKGNKRLENNQRVIYFDRGRLFIEKKPLLDIASIKELEDDVGYHSWKITRRVCEPLDFKCTGWKEVLQGHFFAYLPLEDYHLSPPSASELYPNSSNLDKWWTKHKVPAFLRTKIPVLRQGNQIVHEFLTGKMNPVHAKVKKWAKITFEYAC